MSHLSSEYGLAVVVPARNEARNLSIVLRFIEYNVDDILDIVKLVRVVIVDDASTDATPHIARRYVSRRNNVFRYIRLSHRNVYDSSIGVVRSVHAAVRYLSQEGFSWKLLIQVDADTVLLPGYLKKVLTAMIMNTDIGIAGGITVNERQAHYHIRNTGMMMRREVWDQCRGYRAIYSPDTIIQLCAIHNGWKLAIVRSAKMFLLRPTRLDPYRAGFIDALVSRSIVYRTLRSIRFALSKNYVVSGIKAFLGYQLGSMRGAVYRMNYDWIKELRYASRIIDAYSIRRLIFG